MTGFRPTPATAERIALARARAATRYLQAEAAEARGDPRAAQYHRNAAGEHVAEADRLAGIHIPRRRS